MTDALAELREDRDAARRSARLAQEAYDIVLAALKNLVDRLDEIKAHPAYHSMTVSYHVHGGVYDGPTWEEPLERARALVSL